MPTALARLNGGMIKQLRDNAPAATMSMVDGSISLQQWYCIYGPCKLDILMSFLDPEMNKIPEETLDISISYKKEVDSYWNLYSHDKGTHKLFLSKLY